MFEVSVEAEVSTTATRAKFKRVEGRFLKGPIPLPSLITASQLPGKTLAVYLAIRHQLDLNRQCEVSVPASLLKDFGVDRDSKSRAIRNLEVAGLVEVSRKRGCSARIRLIR